MFLSFRAIRGQNIIRLDFFLKGWECSYLIKTVSKHSSGFPFGSLHRAQGRAPGGVCGTAPSAWLPWGRLIGAVHTGVARNFSVCQNRKERPWSGQGLEPMRSLRLNRDSPWCETTALQPQLKRGSLGPPFRKAFELWDTVRGRTQCHPLHLSPPRNAPSSPRIQASPEPSGLFRKPPRPPEGVIPYSEILSSRLSFCPAVCAA